ncbi:MAG: hypothetical protein KDK78_12010, partial [Chlamydiia bacterium]|nr:hypothetical protein [Chlamydiia bacterium]
IALDSPAAFEQRQARLQELEQQLSREFQGEGELPSCLQILLNACNGDPTRASQALIATLSLMDADQTRVLKAERPLPEQLQTVMDGLQWDLDPVLRHGGLWAAQLVPELESASSGGADIAELLASRHWPLSKDLQEIEDRNAVLTAFTQQVFMLASQLPEPPRPVQERANENAQIFSSCLTAYGFDLRHLLASIPVASTKRGLEIECSAQAIYESADPSRKLEANTPFITVAIEADGKKEVMQLPYDRYGTGLKWPALDGRYLVRYQPQFQTLPHRIRLHQARQLSYAGSAQAFSFESDVTVLENGKDEKVATLSMNRVYETRDGYRFYMANLYPPTPGQIKQAQIVVNQDPVRYTVTYPGAILMAFGSIWLFWRRRRKFEKKERVL